MSLRIPHRRVSPRSRRRYRAIRNFFRKTLGSLTSHSGIRINSSIAVNVTDLKHRVVGIKRQQNEVALNYRDGNLSRREIEDSIPIEENGVNCSPKLQRRQLSDRDLEEEETKVLYKTSNNLCQNSQDYVLKLFNDLSDRDQHSSDRMNYEQYTSSDQVPRRKSKKNKHDTNCENFNGRGSKFPKHRNHAIVENSISGLGSYETLDLPILRSHRAPPHPSRQQDYNSQQQEYNRHIQPDDIKGKRRKDKAKRYKSQSPSRPEERRPENNKIKLPEADNDMNQHFITDIINRQYRPLSFFGRRASDYSRISTPVCRDQRYSARELTIADSEVSTCYREPAVTRRCAHTPGVSGMRSVCDTRLYSAVRPAHRPRRRRHVDNYNDSSLYDVVPVKEKSSPKSRRKFIEDNMILNEVPPSPRTQRPRLNLDTRNYSDGEDYEQHLNQPRRRQSPYRRRRPEYIDTFKHDMSSEESQNGDNEISPKYVMRTKNTTRLHDDIGTTMSSQQYLAFPNNPTNVTLNNIKTQDQDNVPADKADKALSEIKNILQSFLQELKKDSSTSQSDQTNESANKNTGKELDGSPRGSGNETSNATKNSAASSFNCGLGQAGLPTMPPQLMPGFPNPCCYPPMIPIYGAHGVPCLHNSCLVASPSCLCAAAGCGHHHRATAAHDVPCRTCSKVNCTGEEDEPKKVCETDELIREIYNYVARNPSVSKKVSSKNSLDQSRQGRPAPSLRKSMHALRQDANVGTPPLRCYSKSCEAIASRQLFDSYYAPNPCYSDSLLEKLSQEAMDYEMPPCETNEYKFVDKQKPKNANKQQPHSSKFVSALRLIRKNKKNRKENIHEVCQSEQSIEVDVIPKTRQHFNQEFATYTMHGQEFLHLPPAPPVRRYPHPPHRFDYDYPPYDPRLTEYPSPGLAGDRYDPRYDGIPGQTPAPMYDNPYEPQYRNMQPQVPLCLKEVEVRSIATQSEKKTPYFRMFSQVKKQPQQLPQPPLSARLPVDDRLKTNTTQTFSDTNKQEKPRKLFNLKPQPSKPAPKPSLSERIQKDITKNDATMSNALIKKFFYKRNPFSPQNRFVRTIMEKDTVVYKWRPRLFV